MVIPPLFCKQQKYLKTSLKHETFFFCCFYKWQTYTIQVCKEFIKYFICIVNIVIRKRCVSSKLQRDYFNCLSAKGRTFFLRLRLNVSKYVSFNFMNSCFSSHVLLFPIWKKRFERLQTSKLLHPRREVCHQLITE